MFPLTYTNMSSKPLKKVGVKDIAALAGVSIGTVDRVLHNRGEVKRSTRERVLDIVEDLGYTPNILAKSLSSKKRIRLAIVIPDSTDNNPYWKIPIKGIDRAAVELEQYNTDIIYKFFDASRESSFNEMLKAIKKESPDGVVLNPVFKEVAKKYLRHFEENNIPYVFIDVNLKGTQSLGYFGQDAWQSGRLAARLMHLSLPSSAKILIVKQTNRKVFSQHIESRVEGFKDYIYKHKESPQIIDSIEIDLLDSNEPSKSLQQVIRKKGKYDGLFVPNSRVFRMAEFMKINPDFRPVVVAYDLLEENIRMLREEIITCLISQKPDVQAHKAITALFDHLISRKSVKQTNYSPIDIIFRENLENYFDNE